jgi:hypothetical protein
VVYCKQFVELDEALRMCNVYFVFLFRLTDFAKLGINELITIHIRVLKEYLWSCCRPTHTGTNVHLLVYRINLNKFFFETPCTRGITGGGRGVIYPS